MTPMWNTHNRHRKPLIGTIERDNTDRNWPAITQLFMLKPENNKNRPHNPWRLSFDSHNGHADEQTTVLALRISGNNGQDDDDLLFFLRWKPCSPTGRANQALRRSITIVGM